MFDDITLSDYFFFPPKFWGHRESASFNVHAGLKCSNTDSHKEHSIEAYESKTKAWNSLPLSCSALCIFFQYLPQTFPSVFIPETEDINFTGTLGYSYSEDQQNNANLSRLRNSERFHTGAKHGIQYKINRQSVFSVSSLIIFSKDRMNSHWAKYVSSHLYHLS